MRYVLVFSCLLGLLTGCDGEATDTRLLGPDDPAATLSCMPPATVPVTAATSSDAASDAVLDLPPVALTLGSAYRVTLPAGAESYAVLRVHTMHNDVAIYVSDRDMIVGLDPDGIPSGLRHAVCGDVFTDDYRTHVHAPGDYMLTFAADGPREITVLPVLALLGHGDGGVHDHDGGVHDHDGGVHEHDGGHTDHDGGHTDHDAGHADHDAGHTDHDAGHTAHDAG